jgi:hypothetical protein
MNKTIWPQEQIKAQKVAVQEMETSSCQCLIYHPIGSEWVRFYKEWIKQGKNVGLLLIQLFGNCPNKQTNEGINQ